MRPARRSRYTVHLALRYPGWDERGGFRLDVLATSKREAIAKARRAWWDGPLAGVGATDATLRVVAVADPDEEVSP